MNKLKWAKFISIGIVILISFISCETENCQINYESDLNIYNEAVKKIHELGLGMNSNETYFRPAKSFNSDSKILNKNVFDEVEYVECHKDSTIIFQAYNCQNENSLKDVVYFLSYCPKGIEHLNRKRNLQSVIEIERNWFYGKHINTVAD